MRIWPRQWLSTRPRRVLGRCFYSELAAPEDSVEVSCASSGSITVDLYNVRQQPSSSPLLIYIPPFSSPPGTRPFLPGFLRPYPTAVINYRWSSPVSTAEPDFSTPTQWPTPIHDVLAGYTWIVENFRPQLNIRRDLYVCGSHAGASLATSLALTEAHHHEHIAVRGLVAWNGIFNWTMFLPDHMINKPTSRRSRKIPSPPEEGSPLHMLQLEMPDLFKKPIDLFDHFASPSLFFHTPGVLAPPTFSQVAAMTSLIDNMSSLTPGTKPLDLLSLSASGLTALRRSSLMFPPKNSTLKLPATLLLHDSPAALATRRGRKPSTARRRGAGHTFEAQAQELAGFMRRSLEKIEFKERLQWDEDFDDVAEMERRITILDVGENEHMQLGERGQQAIMEWLEERISL